MMFEPNWASPPGDTITRLAAANNIALHELAKRIGLDSFDFAGIMEGRKQISDEVAAMLSSELASPPQFWIDRYRQFTSDKARILQSSPEKSLSSWATQFPTAALRELGWLPKGSRGQHLSNDILNFFGCDTINAWNEHYSAGIGQIAFRTSFAFENDEMATLAWLRMGEVQCEKISLATFSVSAFRDNLPNLKALCVQKHPEIFFPNLQAICAKFGVSLVSSRAPKGCRASGATWTNKNGNPVILLSFRYLSEDHFWFTFFHEAAHVILHGTDHISIDGADPSPLTKSRREDDADNFAQNCLLPLEIKNESMSTVPTRAHVRNIARRAGVTPGIIVGQLQKAKVLKSNQFNDLKRRYKWNGNNILPILSQPRKYT